MDAADLATELVAGLDALSDQEKTAAFPVLGQVLGNIAANPGEPKFRQLKKSNKKLQSALMAPTGQVHPPVLQLLAACGFVDTPEALVCEAPGDAVALLEACAELLVALGESMPAQPAGGQRLGGAASTTKASSTLQPTASAQKPQSAFQFQRRKGDQQEQNQQQLDSLRAQRAEQYAANPMPAPSAPPAPAKAREPVLRQPQPEAPAAPAAGAKKPGLTDFKPRHDLAKQIQTQEDEMARARRERRERFDKAKDDPDAFNGEAYQKPASVAPGGYTTSWYNPFGWGSGSSDPPAPGPNSGRKPKPERPAGPRMKTLGDLPKPARGGG